MDAREKEILAQSRMHALPRCSCNCVCRLGMLEVVWRRLGGRPRCLVPLFFICVSLAPFRPLSLSLSVSPRVPFTLLSSGVPLPRIVHFPLSFSLSVSFFLLRPFAPCPGFSFSLFKIPAGSFDSWCLLSLTFDPLRRSLPAIICLSFSKKSPASLAHLSAVFPDSSPLSNSCS